VVIVLNGGQLLIELPHVVIVHKSDRADYLAIGGLPGLFDQFVANQVAERLGAVGIAALSDEVIELVQQVAVDGDANSAQAAHG